MPKVPAGISIDADLARWAKENAPALGFTNRNDMVEKLLLALRNRRISLRPGPSAFPVDDQPFRNGDNLQLEIIRNGKVLGQHLHEGRAHIEVPAGETYHLEIHNSSGEPKLVSLSFTQCPEGPRGTPY